MNLTRRAVCAALALFAAIVILSPAADAEEYTYTEDESAYTDEGMPEDSGYEDYYIDEDYELPVSDEDTIIFDEEYTDDIEELASTLRGTNVRTRVVSILDDSTNEIDGGGYTISSHVQLVKVRVLEGEYKDQTLTASYDLSDAWGGGNEPDPARVGDMLICQFTPNDDGSVYGVVVQYGRHNTIIWLSAIFLLLLIFFGGKRGLRSVIALAVTCVGLIAVMIPAIVNGMNAVFASVLACIFAVSVTLIIVYGFSKKSLAAGLGALSGLVFAGILVAIMNVAMNMTGLVDDESMYLAQSVGDGTIDLRGILFAAILISVLGGTIDVGISIASSLDELKQQAPDITGAELMKSGINIGIDIMGASLNTLILSYVGSSMHLLMLFYTYNNEMLMVINDEMIACEILRAMAGSYGLLLTVPLTSFVAAAMMCKGNFGRLSPDCFPSVVIAKRVIDKIRGLFGGKSSDDRKKAKKAEKEPEDVPESLYATAHRHMETADSNGAFDDEDDEGYDEFRTKKTDSFYEDEEW